MYGEENEGFGTQETETMKRVLIVEDEPSIADLVSQTLRRNGFETRIATDGDDGLMLIYELKPDVVILDLMLPKMDGWEVCRRVKNDRAVAKTPILMLTARRSERDAVEGLELGADDYVRKPFSCDELVARVKSLLRRSGGSDNSAVIINGGLEFNLDDEIVMLYGKQIEISPTEFRLLEPMVKKFGRTVGREELLGKIWNSNTGDTRTVDVHISRLRRKFEDGSPRLEIRSFRGKGYRLVWGEDENDS